MADYFASRGILKQLKEQQAPIDGLGIQESILKNDELCIDLKIMKLVLKTMNFVLNMMNFVHTGPRYVLYWRVHRIAT